MELLHVARLLLQIAPELEGCLSVGCIDGNAEKYVGVYGAKRSSKQRICIGGKDVTRLNSKQVSILIHWTHSPVEAERKAIELYNKLYGLVRVNVEDIHVVSIVLDDAPAPAGTDTQGIYEYVINAKINYEMRY